MTTTTQIKLEELGVQILQTLEKNPGTKAVEIARLLGAERRDVNRCLSYILAGKVVQDSSYRWSLATHVAINNTAVGSVAASNLSEIGRLCRYYFECIGQDSGVGVSVFASSKHGDPDYAELPSLPFLKGEWPWWHVPGVEKILRKVRGDRAKLTAWLGYPVRLREHRTSNWRGFFVEPVMLWAIELPERPGEGYRFADELPIPNFSVLRTMAMGDATAIVEEAARLDEELGLNSPLEDRPEVDELLARLAAIRPDWDWQEEIDPASCSSGTSLADINKTGIYNRAVILPGERSPYTQGLELELKTLGEISESSLATTALGRWMAGEAWEASEAEKTDYQPLIEVLPMNSEQRAAVEAALNAPHTVVTGPPGTGKSQVVTNLLVNAAWRGMKVLFASKNNKAVDVVEARVNGLGNRPVLLRLGSKEYQAKLSSYLAAMLSGQVSEDDNVSYEEGLNRHQKFAQKLKELDVIQTRTLEARNRVDKFESEVENFRRLFGEARFNSLDESIVGKVSFLAKAIELATDALDPERLSLLGRLALKFSRANRIDALKTMMSNAKNVAGHLQLPMFDIGMNPNIVGIRDWLADFESRWSAAKSVLAYQSALDTLRSSPSFEDIAAQRQDLAKLIADNSARLWRDWVHLAPTRLKDKQRREISDYAALLQVITGPDAHAVNQNVKRRARELQSNVSSMFSCWAVTSLSARGKVPFEPAHFDLVVIDEASQCDIASALPLLFRAKRAVIIGDPMQLRHISSVSRSKDSDLQNKYGLVESRASWMYSVNSLYDLAAGVAGPAQIINLRDHHRCHGDIIEFSNQSFYGGKLRIATRYDHLKRPRNQEPGVVWQDIKGKTVRPPDGGAQNAVEARALVDALEDLLIRRGYNGSVGVVTPFRAQAQLIQMLINKRPSLAEAGAKAGLLVETVHRFQGDERDVMFFSPVISDEVQHGALSFLRSNGNLFNVAITRARGLLHVIGDRSLAASCGVDYLENFALYVTRLAGEDKKQADGREIVLGPDYPIVAKPEQVSDWEKVLYRALYAAGIRPIPQYTIEQYDLDFALIVGDRKLNIEVDGERYHRSWTGELCLRDQLRNQRLIELEWEVKRFWVYEIRDRLPECINSIREWIAKSKSEPIDRDIAEI